MASEGPTRLNVSDMSAPTRQHGAQNVGVSVVLGGGNPQPDADISSQDCNYEHVIFRFDERVLFVLSSATMRCLVGKRCDFCNSSIM